MKAERNIKDRVFLFLNYLYHIALVFVASSLACIPVAFVFFKGWPSFCFDSCARAFELWSMIVLIGNGMAFMGLLGLYYPASLYFWRKNRKKWLYMIPISILIALLNAGLVVIALGSNKEDVWYLGIGFMIAGALTPVFHYPILSLSSKIGQRLCRKHSIYEG
jgi:hypothetical protein